MTEVFDPSQAITMTPAALTHAAKKIRNQESAVGMRLFLKKTGCSGYSYVTEYAEFKRDDELSFNQGDDVEIFVSETDLPLIKGTQIDFRKEGLNTIFVFNNPNATGECGCGESVSF